MYGPITLYSPAQVAQRLKFGIGKKIHGHTTKNSRTYVSWNAMIQRTTNPKTPNYKWYGGKGVLVCAKWRYSFEAFLKDMGERPLGLSLDRINPEGNYTPDNTRWVDSKIQARNKRRNK